MTAGEQKVLPFMLCGTALLIGLSNQFYANVTCDFVFVFK